MVLYFSGTGNSRYVASIIKEASGDTLFSINHSIKNRQTATITSEKPLVFVVPTYAWRIPRVVTNFILNSTFQGNQQAYFVMTCGDDIGNAKQYIEKLCQKKGFACLGVTNIIMPENYIAMFDVPTSSEAKEIIHKANPAIEKVATAIAQGKRLESSAIKTMDRMKSNLTNPLFYSFWVHAKKFYATDACISCGKCVELCPLNNVRLHQGTPMWGKACTHCMACICGCPVEAIEYGKSSLGKPRYFLKQNGTLLQK